MRLRTSYGVFALGLSLATRSLAQIPGEAVPTESKPELQPNATSSSAPVQSNPAPIPSEQPPADRDSPVVEETVSPTAEAATAPTRGANVFWRAEIGTRMSWFNNDGFDPFAHNESGVDNFFYNRTLASLHVSLDRTVFRSGKVTLAAGGMWEFGSKTSSARGADSHISINRLGVSIEPRFHLRQDLYFYGRLIPQATYTRASLDDSSISGSLTSKDWRGGADISLGTSWNFLGTRGTPSTVMWLNGELGYGFIANQALTMKPDYPSSDPRSQVALELGDLTLRGPFLRIGVCATF